MEGFHSRVVPQNLTQIVTIVTDFKREDSVLWLRGTLPFTAYCSAAYLVIVFGLQRYMKNRAAFELRPALALWSASLAVFSLIAAVKLVPERVHVVRQYGWADSVCKVDVYPDDLVFWVFLFVLSKVIELGDTVFIVLRKQKLIFLHWYHHITSLTLAWYSLSVSQALGMWYAPMNFSVHAVMYSYYALKASKIRVPKAVSMVITVLQIVQVIFI